MKKSVFFIVLALVLCLPANYAKAVDGSVFAKNTTISQSYLTLTADATRAQTFTAAVDNFTGFYAYLTDRVNGSAIAAYLINESSKEVIETSSQRMGSGSGWEEFNFNSPLSKESVYRVKILVPTASGVKWVYSGNTYDGGMRYYGENTYDETTDMSFQAWGYDNPTPTGEEETSTATAVSSPTTTTVSAEQTANSSVVAGETPAASVESSIAKPTELKAVYKKGVILSWSASATSGVDGYKIFRSETKGKNYSKIGQTTKKILTYLDNTVLAEKTYYYVVRAYKGSGQSESSSEASITIPVQADAVSTASVSALTTESEQPEKSKAWLWIIIVVAIVGIMGVIVFLYLKRRRKNIKKSGTTIKSVEEKETKQQK